MRIVELLETRPVIRIPTTGPLRHQARRAVAAGMALRPLPGIVMSTRVEADPKAWIYANWLWRPTSVVTGRAALSLQMEPRIDVEELPIRLAEYRRCALVPMMEIATYGYLTDSRILEALADDDPTRDDPDHDHTTYHDAEADGHE